ncbi:hypothetical protein CSUB01_12570 [Colletotrichum sublineola]|uniref:Uncharacterized protein n=1 Tax=Colletotrichum sublineola TaxID=1173701 RepID=A0A066WYB7_COLSU|nr:hypothetical protein CSUB01_12570 [Colletotrichum sublineola]
MQTHEDKLITSQFGARVNHFYGARQFLSLVKTARVYAFFLETHDFSLLWTEVEDDADGRFDIARVYVHNTTLKQRHDDLEAVMTKRLCALNPPPHADQVVHDLHQTRNGGNLPAAIVDSTRPGIDKKASTAALEMAEDMAGNKVLDTTVWLFVEIVPLADTNSRAPIYAALSQS